MSYIRSNSNPEGLYIFGDGVTTFFAVGGETTKKMPRSVFHGLIRKYHNTGDTDISFKGATLQRFWEHNLDGYTSKIKLSFEDWAIIMWETTWTHIAYTNLENINRGIKNKIVLV